MWIPRIDQYLLRTACLRPELFSKTTPAVTTSDVFLGKSVLVDGLFPCIPLLLEPISEDSQCTLVSAERLNWETLQVAFGVKTVEHGKLCNESIKC
jgi:hypothetical protein